MRNTSFTVSRTTVAVLGTICNLSWSITARMQRSDRYTLSTSHCNFWRSCKSEYRIHIQFAWYSYQHNFPSNVYVLPYTAEVTKSVCDWYRTNLYVILVLYGIFHIYILLLNVCLYVVRMNSYQLSMFLQAGYRPTNRHHFKYAPVMFA